jgi:UPF0716 protein FxsA
MQPLHLLLLLFIVFPLLEIYLLIKVSAWIGALPTIFLLVFAAVLGALVLRIQGFASVQRVRQALAQGGTPALALLEGALLMVAGVLLLIPGLISDVLGLLCLVPPWRRWLIRRIVGRIAPAAGAPGQARPTHGRRTRSSPHAPRTLEGEYRREDD